jgi:hypothetical protein
LVAKSLFASGVTGKNDDYIKKSFEIRKSLLGEEDPLT